MATTTSPQAAFTPVIEPHTQRWLDQLAAASAGSPPLYELSPEDARQLLRYIQASVPVRLQPADIDDRVIPGGPTGQVSIRIVRPGGAAGVLPVVFHFHGGGWILGDKDTNQRLDRELANAAQPAVVSGTGLLADAGVLAACCEPAGLPVPWRSPLFAYAAGQLARRLVPLPGGIGGVEGGALGALGLTGTPPAAAAAALVVYRVAGYWAIGAHRDRGGGRPRPSPPARPGP